MVLEGVDYSRTAGPNSPSVQALKAAGKRFCGRYCVNDKSPNGRGITAAEYERFRDGGIDAFLYWEGSESWMLGGFAAGAVAAVNAQQNINAAGMPATMPVYFAHDIEPQAGHFAAVDACLRGIASVLGIERTGLYGGRHIIDHCRDAKTARWFCQTHAWSYVNFQLIVAEGIHLLQYDTSGNFIDGTDCDLVRAYKVNYGQASKFLEAQPHDGIVTPAALPWDEGDVGIHALDDTIALAFRMKVRSVRRKIVPTAGLNDERQGGPLRKLNTELIAIGSARDKDGNARVALRDGSWVNYRDVRPLVPLPPKAA